MLRTYSGTKILPVARNSNDATTEFDRQVHNRSPAVLPQTIAVIFLPQPLPRLRHDVGATVYQRS